MVHQGAVFAEIVLFHLMNLGVVDVQMVAVAQNRAWIGRSEIDAHFPVAQHRDLAGFDSAIVHHHGHFCALYIGGQALKLFRLAIDVLERVIERQSALRGAGRQADHG